MTETENPCAAAVKKIYTIKHKKKNTLTRWVKIKINWTCLKILEQEKKVLQQKTLKLHNTRQKLIHPRDGESVITPAGFSAQRAHISERHRKKLQRSSF